jgi:hypothetical protein
MTFSSDGSRETLNPVLVRQWGRPYAELALKRDRLLVEIRYAEQHFLASLSEPLSTHLHDLMRQDAHLLTEMIRLMIER